MVLESKKKIVHQIILDMKNFGLNAIFDIYREFEEGRYQKLRKIRNALTHRFFYVKPFVKKEDKENMSEESFVAYTLELARIVRNSLVYLMNFVYIEEQKKYSELKGKCLNITARDIPDELKRF